MKIKQAIKRRQCCFSEVNGKVFEWSCLACSKNIPATGPLLKKIAQFEKELGHNNLYLFFLQTFQEFVALDEGCEMKVGMLVSKKLKIKKELSSLILQL